MFKLFIIIIIIIITIVISMFCFRFDNGYTLYDVWNCRAAVALTSYYGRASLARRKQRRLQTSICLMKTQPFESNTSSEGSRETRKCPQSSLRLLLILTRAKRGERKVRGMMGRRKETSFPLPPSHRPLFTSAVIVSRDLSLTAYVQETTGTSQWSNQAGATPRHGVFDTRIPSSGIYLSASQLSTEIFSYSF